MSVSNAHVEYGSPVDIFSMGIILWQMLTSGRPYAHLWPTMQIPNRYILLTHIAKEGLRPEIPGWVRAPLAALVEECWAKAEDGRPTATELVRRLQVPPLLPTPARTHPKFPQNTHITLCSRRHILLPRHASTCAHVHAH